MCTLLLTNSTLVNSTRGALFTVPRGIILGVLHGAIGDV
jgi:hypothetical protein